METPEGLVISYSNARVGTPVLSLEEVRSEGPTSRVMRFPTYNGSLLVGIEKLPSTAFFVLPGKKVVAARFFELEKSEAGEFSVVEMAVADLEDAIQVIQEYSPVSRPTPVEVLRDDIHDLNV